MGGMGEKVDFLTFLAFFSSFLTLWKEFGFYLFIYSVATQISIDDDSIIIIINHYPDIVIRLHGLFISWPTKQKKKKKKS